MFDLILSILTFKQSRIQSCIQLVFLHVVKYILHAEMVGQVNEIVRRLEENETDDKTALKRDSVKGKGCCTSFGKVCNFRCCGNFLTSRPLAVLLACLYGLYLYYVVTYGVLSSDRQMEEMPKDDPFGLRNQTLNSEMLVVDCTPNFHTSKVPMNKTKVEIDVIWHKDW